MRGTSARASSALDRADSASGRAWISFLSVGRPRRIDEGWGRPAPFPALVFA